MSNPHNSSTIKSKKDVYENYIKKFQLEKIIAEMTNSLIQSQIENPIIFMIKYLTGLLSEDEKTKNNINVPPPYPQGIPIVKYPKFKTNNVLSKYLTKEMWNKIKTKKTLYNNNINDLTKLSNNSRDDKIGCCIVDDDCVNTFEDLLNNIICDVHNISKKHLPKFSLDINSISYCDENEVYIFNELKDHLNRVLFEFNRNLDGYSINCNYGNKMQIRKVITKEILKMKKEGYFEEDFKEIYNFLSLIENEPQLREELDFMEKAALIDESYDESNRAIFSNKDGSIIILINFSNHFKLWIKGEKEKGNLNIINLYNKGIKIMKRISLGIEFMSCKYGYITSNISLLGGGFRIYAEINRIDLENFKDEIENLHFTKTLQSKETFMTYQDCHLKEESQVEFMIKFFGKFFDLIKLCEEKKKTELKKLNLKEDNYIKLAYDSSFDKLKNVFSPYKRTINDVLDLYIKNENNNFPLLYDKFEYYAFSPFILKYTLFSQLFNLEDNYHISKPENFDNYEELNKSDIERIKNLEVNVYRNLKNIPFSSNIYFKDNLEKVENIIKNALDKINSKNFIGTYYSLEDETAKKIIEENEIPILYNNKFKKYYPNYPKFRGIIDYDFEYLFGIINDLDHFKLFLKIEKFESREEIEKNFIHIIKILNEFGREINFEFNKKLGYLTCNPSFIGNGMKIKIDLKINNLNNEDIDKLNNKNVFYWEEIEDNYITIENRINIGISETEMMCNLTFFIKQLIELDEKKNI